MIYCVPTLTPVSSFLVSTSRSELVFVPPANLKICFSFFKYSFLFSGFSFIDLFALDKLNFFNRFNIYYVFRFSSNSKNFIFSTATSHTFPVFESLSHYFFGSVWAEREIYDLYGVYFLGNPDMRRILTDYGFEGFPLRKDFPLTGYTQIRYDDSSRRIVLEPVELAQEYRMFEFKSPWSKLCFLIFHQLY
jgi:NADH:ubiquinone oxidoreductase subunit C